MGALLSGTGWTPLFSPGFSRNPYNYRVPDVAACQAEAAWRNEKHAFSKPAECLLLCEVVSDSTVLTDRVTKPAEYASTGVPYYLRVELNGPGRTMTVFLSENIENPDREVESDPERVFRQIGQTVTGGGPLPMPGPFTGPLDPTGLQPLKPSCEPETKCPYIRIQMPVHSDFRTDRSAFGAVRAYPRTCLRIRIG